MTGRNRGAFIVIEGLDRSGKSTQAQLLFERLQEAGCAVELIKFPNRTTPIGKMIDSYLRSQSDLDDHAIHLLFAANRWELATSVVARLSSGITLICDRYAFSGVAFSAAKGLPYEWCRGPEIGLPAPDLTLMLNVDPQVARERGGYGEERYEKEEMQVKVRSVFQKIAKEMGEKWIDVDAGQAIADVQRTLWGLVEKLSKGVQEPLQTLWDNANSKVS